MGIFPTQGRHTEHRPPAASPADQHRCIISRHQTLVTVDQRVHHSRHSLDVPDQSADEVSCLIADPAHSVGIRKNILSIFKQSHVQVHTGAVVSILRFGHKCRMLPVTARDGLDRHLKGHHIIRRL